MKNIITALLNKTINEQLKKEKNINLICKDILYQEALIEIFKKNKNIDLLKNVINNENIYKSKLEINKKENNMICFLGNNGVGKSVIIANLGLLMSKINNKTIIVDFDYNNTNKYIFDLKDNNKIKEKIEDYIIKINSNLYYINILDNKFNKEKINYIFERLKKEYKNILIDTCNSYKYLDFIIKNCSKKILLLEPNMIEIKKTEKLIKKYNKYLKDYFILLNKININSIDENIIKKIFKNKKIIGKIKYSKKYNLFINCDIKEIVNKKEFLKIIKNLDVGVRFHSDL